MSTAQLDLFGGSLRDEVLARGGNPDDPLVHEQYHALFAKWDEQREQEGLARQECPAPYDQSKYDVWSGPDFARLDGRTLCAWLWLHGADKADGKSIWRPTLRRNAWQERHGHEYRPAVWEIIDEITLEPEGTPGRLLIHIASKELMSLEIAVNDGFAKRIDT